MAGNSNFFSFIMLGLLLFTGYQVFLAKDPMPFFNQFRSQEVPPVDNTPPEVPEVNETIPSNVSEEIFNEEDYSFKVYYIDVGQGDSTLIRYPTGKYMLIDGGSRYESTRLVSFLQSLNIETIDTVLETHPDSDHVGGLIKVFSYFKINRFLHPGVSCDTLTCEELNKAINTEISNNNLSVIKVNTGTTFYMDNVTTTKIFNPPVLLLGDDNSNSVVIKVTYGSNSFLFSGDCDFACEEAMISTLRDLDSDVLKVGHHGSKSSSSQEFIDLVSPSISVISVGTNSYGHPSVDVLKRLVDTRILRTDELGTITIMSDGEKLRVDLE